MSAVRTHIEFCGEHFPRDPLDIARDQWIADRLPAVVQSLEQMDDALEAGFADVTWRGPLLDAYRTGDAIEFLRLVRAAVRQELANDADLDLTEQAYERLPEEAA